MNNEHQKISNLPKVIPTKFSEIIFNKYNERKAKNPHYSLRSFARDLEISPGNLSDILNNKLKISLTKAQSVAHHLNLIDDEKKFFLSLIEFNNIGKKKQYLYDTNYTTLSDEIFSIFSNWYYFAIVELVRVEGFKNDLHWISKRLGINPNEASEALIILKKVGLLKEVDDTLIQTYDFFALPSGRPMDEAKALHKQTLARAVIALDEQSVEERDFSSGFLRVRSNDLPLIQQKIKEFKRNLMSELEAGDNHNSVYNFSIQFFRVDKVR